MKRTTIAAALVLLAGCGSSGGAGSSDGSASPVLVTEKDNGHSVQVRRGGVIELRLHNTYWQVDSAQGDALVVTSRKVVPRRGHCPPGQGCGTVAVDLRAAHDGRVTVRAHRTSCGEARLCTGSEGSFTVGIVVG